jgi:hypothetical protein
VVTSALFVHHTHSLTTRRATGFVGSDVKLLTNPLYAFTRISSSRDSSNLAISILILGKSAAGTPYPSDIYHLVIIFR